MGSNPGFCPRDRHYLYHTCCKGLDFETVFIFQSCLLQNMFKKIIWDKDSQCPCKCAEMWKALGELFQKDLPLASILSWLPWVYTTSLIPLIYLTDRGLDSICSLYLLKHLAKPIINAPLRNRMKQTSSIDHKNGLPGSQTQPAE